MKNKGDINIPAFIVKKNHNGKNVKVQGTIFSLNESAGTCNMKILGKVYRDVPFKYVKVEEGFVDDIKELVKKGSIKLKDIVRKIGTVIKKIKGKVVTLFNGQVLSNNPILIAQQFKGSKSVAIWMNDVDYEIAEDNGVHLDKKEVDEVINVEPDDAKAQHEFWKNFADAYKKLDAKAGVNESFADPKRKYRLINEAWGQAVRINELNYRLNTGKWDNTPATRWSNRGFMLNEEDSVELNIYPTRGDIHASSWVENIEVTKLDEIITNKLQFAFKSGFQPVVKSGETWDWQNPSDEAVEQWLDKDNKARPLLIWGAPGIGKTVIIRNIVSKLTKLNDKYNSLTEAVTYDYQKYSEYVDDADMSDLIDELKRLEKKPYKSKAVQSRISELKNELDSKINSRNNSNSRNSVSSDSRGLSREDLEDALYDAGAVARTNRGKGVEFINPVAIYVTCAGMTKDQFSLPSFSNIKADTSSDNEYNTINKVKDLQDRYGKLNAETLMNLGINSVDDIASTKTVVEIPKTWLPVYKPTGRREIDEILDMETYTLNHTESMEAKRNCGILFIDEFSRVSPDVMNVLMSLIDQREFEGGWKLGSKWLIVAAANRKSDMNSDTANQFKWEDAWGTRFEQYNVRPNLEGWLKWAREYNPKIGRKNIEPEWIVDFIDQSCSVEKGGDMSIWVLINDFNPVTGGKASGSTAKKGADNHLATRNARTWETFANEIYHLNQEKQMWSDPEGYTDENGRHSSPEFIKLALRQLARGKVPGYLNNLDPDDLDDILLKAKGILGNDPKLIQALQEFLDYKRYWTKKRLSEVCENGQPKDKEDDDTVNLAFWKRNSSMIQEIFKMIISEGANHVDPDNSLKYVIDMLLNYCGDANIVKKVMNKDGKELTSYFVPSEIYANYRKFASDPKNNPGGKINPEEFFCHDYFINSPNVDGEKTAISNLVQVFRNIVHYAMKIAQQVSASAGQDGYSTSILSLLIGDKESNFTNGIIWSALDNLMLNHIDAILNPKLQSAVKDLNLNSEQIQLRRDYIGYFISKRICNREIYKEPLLAQQAEEKKLNDSL